MGGSAGDLAGSEYLSDHDMAAGTTPKSTRTGSERKSARPRINPMYEVAMARSEKTSIIGCH
ncbi:unnamed protein product [Spirodela intermedia]|nr:unnamed protein product [Spirodela intermedia]